MPSETWQQHKAMEAAASGHSTLGIPKSVGQDFVSADHGHHFTTQSKAMKKHGLARGENKRHPATSSYTMGRNGNKYRSNRK